MKKFSAVLTILALSGCSSMSNVKTQPTQAEQLAPVLDGVNTSVSLTVITSPEDAQVRIMNIKPKYQDGIELESGKYDIEVTKNGYSTFRKWVSVDKKTILTVNLESINI
ncbi:PEGA domain-containing protein [Pseudoalteromonas mariniglutinosa]|uniref:PEGA domain-containing protein n=1 Tax=Pseudoalteromonas mariniglutinosa TaxID=206042 RepID=UPI00384C8642